MPLKSESKAFFIIMSIAFASLLFGSAIAQDCIPSAGKQCYYYDELNRLKEVRYPDGTKIIYLYDELGNRTYTEMYKNPFTLTVQKTGTGTGTVTSAPERINCGTTCSKRFSSGTEITLTPIPDAKNVFTSWSDGCSGSGVCKITLSANTNVRATFTKYFPLTVNKSGNGTGTVTATGITCGSDCGEEYPPGTTVTLTATTTDPCMTFTNWSGGCSGTGTSCSVAMTESKTVTAKFSWIQPTVDFTPVSQITGTAPFQVTFTDNSDCATAWNWNFGDSDLHATENTSTARNPAPHTYRLPGRYNVTHTASNPDHPEGSVIRAKSELIVASPCYHYPTKIGNIYYESLTEAISAVVSGTTTTIKVLATDLNGSVSIGKEMTLEGGYDCDYLNITTGATAIDGDVTIDSGSFTVTMENFLVD